jgi:uncharacterized protein (DUF2062 family)
LQAFGEFFKRLGDGDPVAVGILIGMLVLAALAGLIVYLVHRKLKADDDAEARRKGRKL